MISPQAIEAGARAICTALGDDPDQLTYAHEMVCTGRDREPMHRWQYWTTHAEAAIAAALAAEGLALVQIGSLSEHRIGLEWFERTFEVPLGDKPGAIKVDEIRAMLKAAGASDADK